MNKGSGQTTKGTVTKRQAVREKRRQQQRRQRLIILFVVVGAALIVSGLLILPSMLPAGDIVQITPQSRPMVNGRNLGDPNAPVKIEVFEDFQCPSCQSFSEQIEPQVVETYGATGKVYYTFRHFPFLDDNQIRKESDQAANASMCAAEQGRFWDYHDMLFANWKGENQGAFIDRKLISFAEALGLDMNAFNTCFRENRYKDEIDADRALGESLGVQGTPSVFVNGELLTPGFVPSFSDISQAVEATLSQP